MRLLKAEKRQTRQLRSALSSLREPQPLEVESGGLSFEATVTREQDKFRTTARAGEDGLSENIQRAAQVLQAAAPEVAQDPTRPGFHLLPPARWMNGVCGGFYYRGWHHVFYQPTPYVDQWGTALRVDHFLRVYEGALVRYASVPRTAVGARPGIPVRRTRGPDRRDSF